MNEELTPIEIRKRARRPRIWVAVMAGKCEPTVRAYELDREAVSHESRVALDPIYRQMASHTDGLDQQSA